MGTLNDTSASRREERGWMVYPAHGWRKWIFTSPVVAWRLGLAWMLPPNFLLLTTFGRKSGQPRRTMLEYFYLRGRIYISSGWGERSQWYKNIAANPAVTVQTAHNGTFSGRAVRVTGEDEYARLFESGHTSPMWAAYLNSLGIEDRLEDFMAKKERMVVFRIEPADPLYPPPMATDLVWVWPLATALLALFWRTKRRT